MKTQLLAFGILATSMGFAQDNGQMRTTENQSGCCSTCCSTPCCCTPKPKKCIDCECYTPQWYDMSCDCGWFLTVDFLYFYGREDQTSYAAKVQTNASISTATPGKIPPANIATINSLNYIKEGWDPGVRVGIGFRDECDGWDTYLYWTYYRNTESSSTSVEGYNGAFGALDGFALINPWLNSGVALAPLESAQGIIIPTYEKLSGRWRFTFNSFDLEFGRRYWLSKCFTMRPYASIRGIWTDTRFRVIGTNPNQSADPTNTNPVDTSQVNFDTQDRFRNENWGVGLVGGFQPTWFFSPCFSLYGNASLALLWGRREVRKTEIYTGVQTQISNGVLVGQQLDHDVSSCISRYSGMQPMLDVGLGLRWEDFYCCNQYHFAIDLGWEHHILFNHNIRYQTEGFNLGQDTASLINTLGPQGYDEIVSDVSFGGLVIRVNFGF